MPIFLKSRVAALIVTAILVGPAAWSGRYFEAGLNETLAANEIVVRLMPGAGVAIISRYFPGSQILHLGGQDLYRVRFAGPVTTQTRVALERESLIHFVEPNRVRRTTLTPNDPQLASQWALQNVQAAQAWGLLPGRFLTAAAPGSNRIKVAVLDTGVDCTHPDFANSGGTSTDAALGGQILFSASQAVQPTSIASPACAWQDDHGHGTHTAGIIGASGNNGIGIAGLGYPVELVIYKVLDASGSGTDSQIATAIMSASDAGVQVISMSLGGQGYSQTLETAIQYAWQRNVLVIAAAGNSANSALTYPAAATHAIGVAATDSSNNPASFSNFGDYVEIAAPGVAVLSTLPTYATSLGNGSGYGFLSGTSMATPHVAAAGALIGMTTPGVAAEAIAQRMFQSAASQSVNGGWDAHHGYGALQVYNAINSVLRSATSGAVRGQITDSSNLPIAAQVTINGQIVNSDSASGLFRFPNLSPGTYALAVVAAPFATQNLSVTVAPGSDTVTSVAMGRVYGKIAGQVTASAVPLPYAIVQAFSGSLIQATAVADLNGQYALWLPAGSYTVRASAISYSGTSALATVTGGGTTALNVVATVFGRLLGTASDAAGTVSGAQILATGPSTSLGATSNASGSYSTIRVPSGTYSVQASTSTEMGSVNGVSVTTDTTANVILGPAPIITIATSPGGLTLTVDGSNCAAPCSFQWAGGTNHTIGAVSPQTIGATQYVYASWSDGGAQTHTITAGNVAVTYTAGYTSGSAGNWYGPWNARRKLTIDHTKVSATGPGTLTNFPVLVSMTDPELKVAGNGGKVGKADGTDILFTAADGTTKLNHEMESYDPVGGKLVAWVQAPAVSAVAGADTGLYLYYGNAGAADQQNKTGVWDGGYRVVNHFKDAAGSDSTVNGNAATPSGGASVTASGVAGPGYTVDGVTGQLTIPYSATWNGAFSSYTMEFWIKAGAAADYSGAVAIGGYGSGFNAWFYANGSFNPRMDTASGYCATSGPVPLDNAFHHVALTYDSAKLNVYIDGIGRQYPSICSGNIALPAGALTIGRFAGGAGVAASFDELRISAGTPRSQDWIVTGYNNQKSPSTFYSVGAPEVNPGGSVPVTTIAANPAAGLALTVDGSNCAAPCSFQWTAGTNHTIGAVSPQTIGATQYVYASWSDGGAQTHTVVAGSVAATYTAGYTSGSLPVTTITTNPAAGLTLTVDGSNCAAPCSFQWAGGTNHTIGAVSPQTIGATQYVYASWSDGGAQTHTITAGNVAVTYTAGYTSGSAGNWYGPWNARRKLTIDHTKVSATGPGTLTNFPVLVSMTDPELKVAGNGGKVGKADGTDILFTAADGTTKLNHEMESYDPVGGKLVAWVQAPAVSAVAGADTGLYLYYGNAGAADQQNKTGVWDGGYRVVNHFKDAAGSDSTVNGNAATPSGGASVTASGVAGPGYTVDGVTGQLTIPYSATWNGAFSSYTMEFWIKAGAAADYSGAVAIGGYGSGFNAWFYANGSFNPRMDTASGYCATSGPVPLDNAFHHVALTYDSAKLNVYIDGIGRQYPSICSGNIALPAGALTIGRFAGGAGVAASFDELRISAGTPRSQDWIVTGYNNQKSPSTFYSVGAPEVNPGGSVPVTTIAANPAAGLALTVDGSNCAAPCSFQWTAGTNHTIGAVSPQTIGATQYVYASWSDGGAQTHTVVAGSVAATYTAGYTSGSLPVTTITTNPAAGLTLTVDGSNCAAPCSFQWAGGTNHTIGAVSPQTIGATQYVYASWSDGGAQTHTITAGNVAVTYTAGYTSGSAGNWYGPWNARRKLTIDHTKVSATGPGTLTNFPVLVSMTDPELKVAGNGGKVGKADGTDILFTAADGTTKLNHEMESYDPVGGKLVAWVQAPAVSAVAGADTGLYLYYGNAGAADQQNKTGVWDGGYRVVNHFKDAAGSDSTVNGNAATPSGGASMTASGVAGPGYTVDGVTGQLTIPYSATWNGAFSSYTMEFWIKAGAAADYSGAVAIGGYGSGFNAWFYANGSFNPRMDTASGYCATSGPVPLDNAFHHVALTYDSAKLNVYIDGIGRQYPSICSGNIALPAGALTIGRFAGGAGVAASFDELRISAGTPRSQDWIVTGYNNQKSPSTFYSVGAPEVHP